MKKTQIIDGSVTKTAQRTPGTDSLFRVQSPFKEFRLLVRKNGHVKRSGDHFING